MNTVILLKLDTLIVKVSPSNQLEFRADMGVAHGADSLIRFVGHC
jgi:hypothetical protein